MKKNDLKSLILPLVVVRENTQAQFDEKDSGNRIKCPTVPGEFKKND